MIGVPQKGLNKKDRNLPKKAFKQGLIAQTCNKSKQKALTQKDRNPLNNPLRKAFPKGLFKALLKAF